MRPLPLTSTELTQCLGKVARPSTRAALLLALPLGAIVHGDEWRNRTWHWRGTSRPMGTDPIEALAGLVADQSRAADCFIDPMAPPSRWVRVVRSGSSTVAFGFGDILGGPALSADVAVTSAEFQDIIDQFVAGTLPGPPAVVRAGNRLVLLSGSASSWRVEAVSGARRFLPRAHREAADPLTLIDETLSDAAVLPGTPGTWVVSGTPVDQPRWRLDVPVCADGRSTSVGVSPASVAPGPCPWELPEGWDFVGWHAGDVVAVTPRGTWAYLRRTSPVLGSHEGTDTDAKAPAGAVAPVSPATD